MSNNKDINKDKMKKLYFGLKNSMQFLRDLNGHMKDLMNLNKTIKNCANSLTLLTRKKIGIN